MHADRLHGAGRDAGSTLVALVIEVAFGAIAGWVESRRVASAVGVGTFLAEEEHGAGLEVVPFARQLCILAEEMEQMTPPVQRILELARRTAAVRPRDLEAQGIPRVYLTRLVRRGLLRRASRGLYVLPDAEATEHHTLAEASKRVPHGVVCLLSALRFHGLTTQSPFQVWMAIDHKVWAPQTDGPPLRIVRMSGAALESGVEIHQIEGIPVRVFSAAKTVADCVKFRNKVGLDVALEALRDYRRTHPAGMDELWRYSKIDRVSRVIRPYLEAG